MNGPSLRSAAHSALPGRKDGTDGGKSHDLQHPRPRYTGALHCCQSPHAGEHGPALWSRCAARRSYESPGGKAPLQG